MMMQQQQRYILVAICLFGTIVNNYITRAQVVGEDLCACSPRSYTFRLNFTSTCEESTLSNSSAIIQPQCVVRGGGSNNTNTIDDAVPVQIQTIQIVEVGQGFRGVAQVVEQDTFSDGSTITYVSIVDQPAAINATSLPRGIQVVMTGRNALDQILINIFFVTFTNNCTVYPAIAEGATIGWAVFTNLLPPSSDLCPAVPAEGSDAPSASPGTDSEIPSSTPSIAPGPDSDAPSASPSVVPIVKSESPSSSPVLPTSDAPSAAPGVMSDSPSAAPVSSKSDQPSVAPIVVVGTNTPTMQPSVAPIVVVGTTTPTVQTVSNEPSDSPITIDVSNIPTMQPMSVPITTMQPMSAPTTTMQPIRVKTVPPVSDLPTDLPADLPAVTPSLTPITISKPTCAPIQVVVNNVVVDNVVVDNVVVDNGNELPKFTMKKEKKSKSDKQGKGMAKGSKHGKKDTRRQLRVHNPVAECPEEPTTALGQSSPVLAPSSGANVKITTNEPTVSVISDETETTSNGKGMKGKKMKHSKKRNV